MTRSECYLCHREAHDPRGGTAYYRFYNISDAHWDSLPICAACFAKLRGPERESFIVRDPPRE